MPLFSMESFNRAASMKVAWDYIVSSTGDRFPRDKCLLPDEVDINEKIVWLEILRQYALKHGSDLSILAPYRDFRECALERRPDPTWDQWIWLYQQIGERHRDSSKHDAIQIMACRDALLPFLASVPDKVLWDKFKPMLSLEQPADPDMDLPFPYPNLEEAFREDAPEKVELLQTMCRDVSNDAILNRAVALKKKAIVEFKLKTAPIEQKIEILADVHASWEDPAPLFRRFIPLFKDEIAAWHDPWGNGFFWYLYRRPVLSQEIIKRLPKKVLATFGTKNRYGISPADVWLDYCPLPSWVLTARRAYINRASRA